MGEPFDRLNDAADRIRSEAEYISRDPMNVSQYAREQIAAAVASLFKAGIVTVNLA
jgi:hypothetical protein